MSEYRPTDRSAHWGWPLVITISVALMGLLLLADVEGPLRVVVALWFFAVCPGMAFAPLLPFGSRETTFALGVVLSLICTMLVATVIVEIGGLSQTSGYLTLAAICLLGSALQVVQGRRDSALA